MRIVALAGGIGGSRFLRGVQAAAPDADLTVVVNTGDDLTLYGLRICPDLDTVMYTLGGGIDEERGWGRRDETFHLKEELAAYDAPAAWFGLGDRDMATHLVRAQMTAAGYGLAAVTEALCARWQPGARLLPMTEDRFETHVLVEVDGQAAGDPLPGVVGAPPRGAGCAEAFVYVGADAATPGPGVLEAIEAADVVLLPAEQPRREHRHGPAAARGPGGTRGEDGRGPVPGRRRRAGARHGRPLPVRHRRGDHGGGGRAPLRRPVGRRPARRLARRHLGRRRDRAGGRGPRRAAAHDATSTATTAMARAALDLAGCLRRRATRSAASPVCRRSAPVTTSQHCSPPPSRPHRR